MSVLILIGLIDSMYQAYQSKMGVGISFVDHRFFIKHALNWDPKRFSTPVKTLSGFLKDLAGPVHGIR